MMNSRDWEKADRRQTAEESSATHHCNRRGTSCEEIGDCLVALLAGALMLPNHEALARGGGGFGGGHGGGFGGGGFHGSTLDAVSTA